MIEIENLDQKMIQINNETLSGWVVWYSLGNNDIRRYDSKNHNWIDLPKIGVQYLYRIYNTHIEQNGGMDFYCPYQLIDIDDIRPWIKFGLMIDQTTLSNILEEVIKYTKQDFENI